MENMGPNTQIEEQTEERAGRTFTQEELNEIVQKRLAREKEKFDAAADDSKVREYLEMLNARDAAIEQRELKQEAKERLFAEGLPTEAADVLRCETRAEMESGVQKLKQLWGPRFSQAVKDEVDARFRSAGHTPPKGGSYNPAMQVQNAFKPKG